MKKTTILLLCMLMPLLAKAQVERNFLDRPYIEVSGKADMEVTPDEIFLGIRISEQDNKAKQSVEKLENDMKKALQSLGIDIENDLVVVDFSSNFRQQLLKRSEIFTTKEYQLKVNSGAVTAAVFYELEKLGISNITVQKIGHSDIDSLQNEVKVMAIKAARDKAEMLAKAIDHTIGAALHIVEMNAGYYPRSEKAGYVMMRADAGDTAEAELPAIEFEKIKLEYSILAKFQINSN